MCLLAPVAAWLHSSGVRLHRYLDNWLVLAESEDCLRARDMVLDLCLQLGMLVNPLKSDLVPSQCRVYLGMRIDMSLYRAFPSEDRVARFRRVVESFTALSDPPAELWLRLLGHLSSLEKLMPGGRLRMRAF